MNDEDGPTVARAVYKELMTRKDGFLDKDAFPYALDDAVQSLRRDGAPPHRWAPFIHIGA